MLEKDDDREKILAISSQVVTMESAWFKMPFEEYRGKQRRFKFKFLIKSFEGYRTVRGVMNFNFSSQLEVKFTCQVYNVKFKSTNWYFGKKN